MKRIVMAAALMAATVCFGTSASAQTVETKVKNECCKAGAAEAKTCCKAVSDTAKAKGCANAAKTKATTATAKTKNTAKTAKAKAANVKKKAVDATTAATSQVNNATK